MHVLFSVTIEIAQRCFYCKISAYTYGIIIQCIGLWSIGFRDKAFRLFECYLSNRYIQVVTPLDSSHLCCVTAGVPQGAIWSPCLFNLYIRQLPTILKHSMVVGYVKSDDHSL